MKYLTNSKNVCQHFISKVFFQLSTIESFHEFYSELIHKQLDLMGLTYCEILNEINLSQVNLKSNSQPNTLGKAQCAMVWLDGLRYICLLSPKEFIHTYSLLSPNIIQRFFCGCRRKVYWVKELLCSTLLLVCSSQQWIWSGGPPRVTM